MSVRAKVQLQSSVSHAFSANSKTLRFSCVYELDGSKDSENARFTKATPNGSIEMQIDNPDAVSQFELGKFYYVDFTPAD